MSSGHGALHFSGMLQLSLSTVALLFVLKIAASVISLGSGFRGGLFFSSLLIGALGGHLLAVALTTVFPSGHFDSNAYAVIGMGGLSAEPVGPWSEPTHALFPVVHRRQSVLDGEQGRPRQGGGDDPFAEVPIGIRAAIDLIQLPDAILRLQILLVQQQHHTRGAAPRSMN